MKKKCLCTNCSFAKICEYRSADKRHCIDYNPTISKLYTEDELKHRLQDDRKSDLIGSWICVSVVVFIILYVICTSIFPADNWLSCVAWPAIISFCQPLLYIGVNVLVAIGRVLWIVLMTTIAICVVGLLVRSVYIISVNIHRNLHKGDKNHA